jgi:acyl carrier protein
MTITSIPAVDAQASLSSPQVLGLSGVAASVMSVLNGIRALQANGLPYDLDTNLTDAGFTSVEMVKVMLGIEAAFDIMIPQDMITPENFTSAQTIIAMVSGLTGQS